MGVVSIASLPELPVLSPELNAHPQEEKRVLQKQDPKL